MLVTICARGGSKGVPNKNIRPLNGIPLLHYSLSLASEFASMHNGSVVLSTDSDDIMRCAEELGYVSEYRRPKELATDNASKVDAIHHAWHYMETSTGKQYSFVLDLDVSSPLRTLDDLNNAFRMIRENERALNIFSVSAAHKNPYFNMVEPDDDGFVRLVKSGYNKATRQSAPPVYEMNASFYLYRRIFFTQGHRSAITDHSLAYLVPHICTDIDTPLDFAFMEFIVREGIVKLNI